MRNSAEEIILLVVDVVNVSRSQQYLKFLISEQMFYNTIINTVFFGPRLSNLKTDHSRCNPPYRGGSGGKRPPPPTD